MKSAQKDRNIFFRAQKNFMAKITQEGLKIIFRHQIFFHTKWPKHLVKIHKKNSKFTKKFFCLEMIFGPSWSHLDKKNFLWISNFFCEFFLSVLVIFYGKKISCLKMIFGPCWSFLDMKFFLARKKTFWYFSVDFTI